jgi:hypothetical protein
VHDVLVYCGDGVPQSGGGDSDGHHGAGGAIAAGILVPCFLFAGCIGAAALAVGRRNGGGAREGFNILVQGARDLPRSMPPVQVPNLPTFGRGANGEYGGYFAGSGNDYTTAGHMAESIPEATVVDASTGQPVLRASIVP